MTQATGSRPSCHLDNEFHPRLFILRAKLNSYNEESFIHERGVDLESAIRRLRQERAVLTAHQGDPQLPASCSLLARRNRLQAESQQAEVDRAAVRAYNLKYQASAVSSCRTAAAIDRDLQRVEHEIESVQRKIAAIDRVLATAESS